MGGMSMRHSLVPLLTAATIAFGFAFAGSTAANAESVERVCEPMEGCRGRGNDRRPDLAAVSVAVPHPRELRRGAALRDVRSRAGPCPSARAGHTVRLPLPMVAAIGSSFRAGVECRPLGHTGRRIHDRIGGPRQLPIRHRCVGQYSVARLSLCGNPLLRAHQAGRVHVRGQRASSRKSRRAQGTPDPFGVRGASTVRTRARRRLPTQKKSPARGGLL